MRLFAEALCVGVMTAVEGVQEHREGNNGLHLTLLELLRTAVVKNQTCNPNSAPSTFIPRVLRAAEGTEFEYQA